MPGSYCIVCRDCGATGPSSRESADDAALLWNTAYDMVHHAVEQVKVLEGALDGANNRAHLYERGMDTYYADRERLSKKIDELIASGGEVIIRLEAEATRLQAERDEARTWAKKLYQKCNGGK